MEPCMWEDGKWAIKFDGWSRGWTGRAVGDEGATIRRLKVNNWCTPVKTPLHPTIKYSSQTIRAATMHGLCFNTATHVTSLRLRSSKTWRCYSKRHFLRNSIWLSAICFNTDTNVTSLCLDPAKCDVIIAKRIFCEILPPRSLQLWYRRSFQHFRLFENS